MYTREEKWESWWHCIEEKQRSKATNYKVWRQDDVKSYGATIGAGNNNYVTKGNIPNWKWELSKHSLNHDLIDVMMHEA